MLCLVPKECIIFILHSRLPLRDGQCSLNSIRLTRGRKIGITHRTIRKLLGLTDPRLQMSPRRRCRNL
jgi:hypothetical protein